MSAQITPLFRVAVRRPFYSPSIKTLCRRRIYQPCGRHVVSKYLPHAFAVAITIPITHDDIQRNAGTHYASDNSTTHFNKNFHWFSHLTSPQVSSAANFNFRIVCPDVVRCCVPVDDDVVWKVFRYVADLLTKFFTVLSECLLGNKRDPVFPLAKRVSSLFVETL